MLIQKELEITIDGKGLYNITEIINQAIAKHRIAKGLCTLFIKHTSASLIIQENADPNVMKDILDFFDRVVPESENYAHREEGPDDMPAHLKTLITNTSVTISVASSKLILGVWQGIYLCEWRKYGQSRSVTVHLLGK